jgi:CO/xanthine dehydrogenase FAD-binding subunit
MQAFQYARPQTVSEALALLAEHGAGAQILAGGTDLASITLCVGVDEAGVTRLSYGSVGPRPVLVLDETGTLADPEAPDEAKAPILEGMLAGASPSPRSMRAGPEYRLAMLRVLGRRALQTAIERLAKGMAR